MEFDYSPKAEVLRERLLAFFDTHIYPNERVFHEEIARTGATATPGARSPCSTR